MTALLAAVWAYAALETYLLAARRSRAGVRAGAQRGRTAMIVAILMTPVFLWLGSPLMAPLLVVPVVAVFRFSLPRISALVRTLLASPWGPSDPPVRRTAADPALVAPALAAPLVVLGALPGGWVAAVAAYGLAGVAAGLLTWWAVRRRTLVERANVGALRRVLVRRSPAPHHTPKEKQPIAA